jgi:hypothetical protein
MSTRDLDDERFQFSLSGMMLAIVPVAVTSAVVAGCIRSGIWFPVAPTILIAMPAALGSIARGRAGFDWGLAAGCVVAVYFYMAFVFVAIVYVLCTAR